MQQDCSKLHACIISTRSLLSDKKVLSDEGKRKYGLKSGCHKCCIIAKNYEGGREKKTQTLNQKSPNPLSDQLQQANKHFSKKQSFSPAAAGNTESVPGTTADRSKGIPKMTAYCGSDKKISFTES